MTDQAIDDEDSVLRMPDVVKLTGISKAHIYKLIREDRFPKPLDISSQAVGWRRSEVQRWIASLRHRT